MSVTDLIFRMIGNSGPLASELQKATREVEKFNRRATSEIAKISKAFGVMGAAAASGFAMMVKSSIDSADQLTKLSARVGLAVEDVSALAFVAEQSGTSIQALERPLNLFAQNLVGTGEGATKFGDSLAKIGVEARNANGQLRPTIDVFADIADQFSQLETGAEKTALAAEIFGTRYGPQLVPLLNQGKDGIEALTAQAERLGLVIDQDTGRAAEQFNDNLNVLRKTFTGVANQVATQILPTLVQYSNKAIDGANDTQALAGRVQFLSNLMRGLLSAIELIVGAFKVLGETIGGVGAATFAFFSGEFRQAANIVGSLGATIKQISTQTVQDVADIWGDAPPITQAARSTGELAGRTFNSAIERTVRRDLSKTLADPFKSATEAISKALEDAARAQERYLADLESRAQRVFLATRTEQERYNATVAELDQLLSAGVISLDTYTRALMQAQDGLNKSSASAEVFAESVQTAETQINQFAQQGAERTFDIFADAFFNPMSRGFDGILSSFAKMLQDMAAQALKQRVLRAFFGAIGGGGVVAAGGGGIGGSAVAIAGAAASGFSTRGSALEYHDAGMGGARSETSTRSSAMTQQLSVTNVNVMDPSAVQQMLMTPEGQRAVLNVMRANREVIL